MQLSIADARALIHSAMLTVEHTDEQAAIIADHLIDCELRGLDYGGMSRALSIIERLTSNPDQRHPIKVSRETPVSALVDAGGQAGFLLGHKVMTLAIAKAKASGIGVVCGHNSWFTGMYSYYMEMATRENLVALCSGGSVWRVAPFGSSEARFGTNPIAFGFPTDADPIIVDFGTAALMNAQATLHKRLGTQLPEGVAFDPAGNPTRDPDAAMQGAIAVWGGAKGSALATAVQLLGLLCGSDVNPRFENDANLFAVVIRPDLFMPVAEFKAKVEDYARAVRGARPLGAKEKPRMPFDRSARIRREALARNAITVPDPLYAALRAHIDKSAGRA